jgi:uncharacterized protein YggU (UPF0235/DUF167 family)
VTADLSRWGPGGETAVPVRVTPGAAREGLTVEPGPDGAPRLRVRVTAPPEDGRANAAVLALLAKALRLPRSALAIERGAASRDKLVRITRG